MNAKDTIAAAKAVAEQHRTKKVYKKDLPSNHMGDTYDVVATKTVHVTMPGEACYIDMSEKDLELLNERVIEKKLSLHTFEFEETKAKETKAKETKAK
jgi:hypothetical protein